MKYLPLIAVLLLGCYSDAAVKRDYLAKNQDIDPETRAAIERGSIRKGMTKEQVMAAWGAPCGYCIGTRSASWGDSWEYNVFGSARPSAGTYVFFDKDGRVSGWSR